MSHKEKNISYITFTGYILGGLTGVSVFQNMIILAGCIVSSV